MSVNQQNSKYDPEPDWEEVYNDPAIRAVTRSAPANSYEPHTEAADARIRETMRREAPWMSRILKAAIMEP